MSSLTAEELWSLSEAEFIKLLDSDQFKSIKKTINFYAPSFSHYQNKYFQTEKNHFPTISITGKACALNCKHCGGKLLENMQSAVNPIELLEMGSKLKKDGAKGVLISGGCRADGTVPLDNFIAVLRWFKKELGLTVFVHTGIVKSETAKALKKAGVDAALIDIIGLEETAKKIFGLKCNAKDYEDSLKKLDEAKLNVVPHIIVGLNQHDLKDEYEALKIIAQTIKPTALVIIAFMPIHGTVMEKTSPPNAVDIAKVIATARVMFPDTPISLGCMRPKGNSRKGIDVLALKAGVDGIAFPDERAIEYAKNMGYNTVFSSYCCAQIGLNLEM